MSTLQDRAWFVQNYLAEKELQVSMHVFWEIVRVLQYAERAKWNDIIEGELNVKPKEKTSNH